MGAALTGRTVDEVETDDEFEGDDAIDGDDDGVAPIGAPNSEPLTTQPDAPHTRNSASTEVRFMPPLCPLRAKPVEK
jgi:hypothetical protein